MAKSQKEPAGRPGLGDRVDQLKEALGYRNFDEMAADLRDIVGTDTSDNRFSEWKKQGPQPQMVAAIAMLHPNPRLCLRWLREGGDLARIRVDPHKLGDLASRVGGIAEGLKKARVDALRASRDLADTKAIAEGIAQQRIVDPKWKSDTVDSPSVQSARVRRRRNSKP